MTEAPAQHVAQMLDGFRAPQCIHVVCALGLPDLVPARGIDTPTLAERAQANADALHRLLTALSTVGIFARDADGQWQHTDASRTLTRDHESGLHDRAMGLGTLAWASWGALLNAVRTGTPAFDTVHGAPFFDYLQQHTEHAEAFGRTMSSWTRQTARAVVEVHDFDAYAHVVDIGGGHGILLDAVLERAPSLRATLCDRPEVIATDAPALRHAHRPRCDLVALDAFNDPFPPADAYLLSWILHDWNDDDCVALLSRCLAANPAADIIVIEMLVDGPTPAAAWFDLEMLVQTGGRERTRAQYEALFTRVGRTAPRCVPTAGTHAVLHSPGT